MTGVCQEHEWGEWVDEFISLIEAGLIDPNDYVITENRHCRRCYRAQMRLKVK